ncbi:MAG: choice-of-anchor L domain-containing protein [Saprospiraceae bacterium]|nr:choice-of-anchor L domain-containing protein [Saprospiraceae bacterium]
MKKFLATFWGIIFFHINIIAQTPPNDECSSAIDLGVAPNCILNNIYSNENATATLIGVENIPSCYTSNEPLRDVWFVFYPSDTIFNYTVSVVGNNNNGNSIINPRITLYRGECTVDGLAELSCANAALNATEVSINITDLGLGEPIFIRVDDYSQSAASNAGEFSICVKKTDPVVLVTDGFTNLEEGTVYDSGGPDEDYMPNENEVFTICPQSNPACINFTIDYYHIPFSEFEITDQINIYDGNNVNGNQIASIGGDLFDPLTVSGGGGVCLSMQASSGCLTIEFISNNSIENEGFKAHWTSSNMSCMNTTPLIVENIDNNNEIINNLTSEHTILTIDTIICKQRAIATFNGDNTNLGLGKGLLLSTGTALLAIGPNNDQGGGFPDLEINDFAGDADLDYLSEQSGDFQESHDACIIELDVFVKSNELTFEYIFGSEEYPEFVNQFNDIFAFFISGPGIVGDPNISNQENIALLPISNVPVEINSVNNLVNWQFYRDNSLSNSIQYDGLTSDYLGIKKSLTARKFLTPCETYHLKLAIADRVDFAYDSGVMIGELKGGTPYLETVYNSGVDYLIENCTGTNDSLIVYLNAPLDHITTYNVEVSGTATRGLDYSLNVPNNITFLPGQTRFAFNIIPLVDQLEEGNESVIISLTNDFGCGRIVYKEITINISDYPVLSIFPKSDTLYKCNNIHLPINVSGVNNIFWQPSSLFSDPLAQNTLYVSNESSWVNVSGNVGACTAKDSFYVKVFSPEIAINALSSTNICNGDTVFLEINHNARFEDLMWTPATGIIHDTLNFFHVIPNQNINYNVGFSFGQCAVSDQIQIKVDEYTKPNLLFQDTTICQTYPIRIGPSNPNNQVIYHWTPQNFLSNENIANPTVIPNENVLYTLISTSEHGYCADTNQVSINIIPAFVDILDDEVRTICQGESVELQSASSTQGIGLSWLPNNNTLSSLTGANVVATPLMSTNYIVKLTTDLCTVFDTVLIKVDSLPDNTSIFVQNEMNTYCKNDRFVLTSETIDSLDYPNMNISWNNHNGILSSLNNYYLIIQAVDSTWFIRNITNGVCSTRDSIFFPVYDPLFTQNWIDTTVCQNDSLLLNLMARDMINNITWSPDTDLSCNNCANPSLIVTQPIQYNINGDVNGCLVNTTFNINVYSTTQLEIITDPLTEITQGTNIKLTATSNEPLPDNAFYNWYKSGVLLSDHTKTIMNVANNSTNEYSVEVFDANGCKIKASILVNTIPVKVSIPNTFTPDNDSVNDYFNIFASGNVDIIEFKIFNRWGELVYNNDNPSLGWNGKYKGKDLPSDAYVYYIKIKADSGEVSNLKGAVNLIR